MKWVLVTIGVLLATGVYNSFNPQPEQRVVSTEAIVEMCAAMAGVGGITVIQARQHDSTYSLASNLKAMIDPKYYSINPMAKNMIVAADTYMGSSVDFAMEWKAKCLEKMLPR